MYAVPTQTTPTFTNHTHLHKPHTYMNHTHLHKPHPPTQTTTTCTTKQTFTPSPPITGGGTDFSDDQVTIEIPAESTRECVNVTVINDDVVECDELFNVTLTVEEGQDPGVVAEFNIIQSHSTATIIDDDGELTFDLWSLLILYTFLHPWFVFR